MPRPFRANRKRTTDNPFTPSNYSKRANLIFREQEKKFEEQLGKGRESLDQLKSSRQRVEKVPSWGETIWGLTKRHGTGLVIQAITSGIAASSVTGAAAAAAKEIASLKAELVVEKAAAAAATAAIANNYTIKYTSAVTGLAAAAGVTGLKLSRIQTVSCYLMQGFLHGL